MKKLIFGALIAVACVMTAATANALPVLDGVTSITGATFSASVTWEVYAPGDVAHGLAGDADYHYFYQVANTDTKGILLFSVADPSKATINSVGWLAGSGDLAPSTYGWAVDQLSIEYAFVPTALGAGKSSKWLYFTSPVKPTYVDGTIGAGYPLDGGSSPLGGPAPEPSSMILLGLGLGLLGARRIQRKFKA
jgi:hypothetical protein